GPLISILALAGWALLLARPSRAGLLTWLPGLFYLVAFSSILHDPFERMFLPVAPHIAMLAAVALVRGARRVGSLAHTRLRAAVTAGVMLVVLLAAAVPVGKQAFAARHDETRLQAACWLDANVPAGAFVKLEWDMVQPSRRHFEFNRRIQDIWDRGWTPQLVSRYMDFVVTTSTNFDRVQRQRGRPDYARQAAYYDEMFNGRLFELAASFVPDLYTFGPEVRIYRSLHPRGRVLGPARTDLDLVRQAPWTSSLRLRRERQREGGFRFRAAHELIAGRATVRPSGWYTLEVGARSPTGALLELGLGYRRQTLRVEGEETVTVRAFLRQGKIWWRVGVGPSFEETDRLLVQTVRLVRLSSTAGEAGPAAPGRASAEPLRPKNESGGEE
ncbi:MAG: hypothetical protein ACE5EG_12650, partial [Thermoanaerobaculia bacterium]